MPRRKQTTEEEIQELNASVSHSNQQTIDMEELTEALQNLQPRPHHPALKPPQFNGSGDVNLFLDRLTDVARLNAWGTEEHLLHLRLSLVDKAADYSTGDTIQAVTDALKTRFGTSQRQARDKLRTLKRQPRQSIHDLGQEVRRLVRLAHPALADQDRTDLAMDVFVQAIDNRALKRHLLATPAISLNDAIQKADEFLQISDGPLRTAAVSLDDDNETIETRQVETSSIQASLAGITDLIKQQTEMLKKMSRPKSQIKCYECGGPHPKRLCTQLTQNQGNETGSTKRGALLSPPNPERQ